jgi:hypothetical protein
MKKLTLPLVGLLAGSVIIDAVQGFVLFNAALCGIPSITGVGAVLTAICGLALLGLSTLGLFFSVAWGILSYALTKKKLSLVVGVAEAIPIFNGIPIFTASTLYYILK